jgi:hypothetical protein
MRRKGFDFRGEEGLICEVGGAEYGSWNRRLKAAHRLSSGRANVRVKLRYEAARVESAVCAGLTIAERYELRAGKLANIGIPSGSRISRAPIGAASFNLLSLFVLLFSSYRTKIAFDLVPRRHYAYGVLRAARQAASHCLGALTVRELGVATGRGLLNLCDVALKVSKLTGVRIEVYRFDTGAGMPPPWDYRDHPELYQVDDFPMDRERLASLHPSNGKLILGELRETLPAFMERLRPEAPLGFVAVDIDYYSSAKDVLTLFSDPDPLKYFRCQSYILMISRWTVTIIGVVNCWPYPNSTTLTRCGRSKWTVFSEPGVFSSKRAGLIRFISFTFLTIRNASPPQSAV